MLHRNIATSNGCDQAVHFTRLHDQVKRRGPLSTSSLPIPVHQAAYGLALGFRNGVGIVARTPSDTYDSAFYFCYQSHLGASCPCVRHIVSTMSCYRCCAVASDDTCIAETNYRYFGRPCQ